VPREHAVLRCVCGLLPQEIAQSLDTALSAPTPSPIHVGSSRAADGSLGLALQSSVTLWDCLQRCWKEGVYIEAVSDKFLRLTLQLLSRFTYKALILAQNLSCI
jgi:hypothetical protein